MLIYHYNLYSAAILKSGKAFALTYQVYRDTRDISKKILIVAILRTLCSDPEMHLIVYFFDEDALKVVLPKKYDKKAVREVEVYRK